MKRIPFLALVMGLLMVLPLSAEYLKNADLSEGLSCWEGNGEAVYLKPDGTEGANTDTDAIPVLKVVLSPTQKTVVSQEISTTDQPTHLHIQVDIFASKNFKRSTTASDYTTFTTARRANGEMVYAAVNARPGAVLYSDNPLVPSVDFWIQANSAQSYAIKMTNLKPGTWTTLAADFQKLTPGSDWTISFCVPPGAGTIYLKNPSVVP
jgi:hypothetical protein